MNAMSPVRFHAVYRELIEENPLAVRAVLKILAVEFTTVVSTLAVTCDARPRLLVNLDFVKKHCRTDLEVKALICHEFLHVLLRHTDKAVPSTPAEHLAFDAVINAIIHRTMGESASALMSRYYADARGPHCLLRPPLPKETREPTVFDAKPQVGDRLRHAWSSLYEGYLVADDIRDLVTDLMRRKAERAALVEAVAQGTGRFLGNHGEVPIEGSDAAEAARALRDALDTALKSMNGSGVFRSPRGRGLGATAYTCVIQAANAGVERWRRETYEVLKRHVVPDPRSPLGEPMPRAFLLPVLSPGDRRAALRALWSPFLPNAEWNAEIPRRGGAAHVYLDVSGSMNAEMPLIVGMLARLTRYIRRPFWAFSTEVAPARIEGGHLVSDTTGGTSMSCVLEHLARTRPEAAVVVTDGYIEALQQADVAAAAATRLHVVVTRDGSPDLITRAGLAYTQLARVPN